MDVHAVSHHAALLNLCWSYRPKALLPVLKSLALALALAGPCLAPGLGRSRTVAGPYALPGYNHGNGQGRCAVLWKLHPGACRPSGQEVSWVN